ncbi:hypothetical protein [Pedobacter alpinus]|uniref:Beta-lactamase-inhibitor-like PepSY-like domain-containing protein n=1 Tax=Pedobacter alpinus TaxID=1590643 RepID=A0ABW5TQD9_9SPHI
MKIISILLFMIISLSIKAQKTVPNKEQTITFIKSHFEGESFSRSNQNGFRNNETNFKVQFENSILTFYYEKDYKWTSYSPWKKDKEKYVIDFADIESISSYIRGKEDSYIVYLLLKAAPGKYFEEYTGNF